MDKRYDHIQCEKQQQDLWAQKKVYQFDPANSGEVFSIDTPPPTISGKLHIGHIFSYTQTDLIARFRRMQGRNVFYPMGYDDNGLPTELYVEKKNKVRGGAMKRSEFVALCIKETELAADMYKDVWQRMGISADWDRSYSTIAPKAQRVAQHSFVELYAKGLIYRRSEPAIYCTSCRTSTAQALLETADIKSTFNTIVFKDHNGSPVHIATTRPELLPACVAVFYHPDDARFAHLNGTMLTTSYFGKQVPVMPDESVDPEKGTGIVMCCTFGDQKDIEWYKKHQLPFVQIIDFDGKWLPNSGPLAGLKVHEARKTMIDLLKASGELIEQKEITHAVHVDERCKKEIEFLILEQWFVKILPYKQDFLDLADQIVWKPAFMKSRYREWVSGLSWDWCISRQRFFGIPFPVWHCQDCRHMIVATPEMLPIDPQETEYPGKVCPQCKSTNLKADTDVMDTWNTSALSPQINAGWPDNNGPVGLPMSMRPQAHDIIRTWAFYTIARSYAHTGMIPWKEIIISGHALAGRGEKFSKSAGNALLDPINLLQAYSADSVRYWAASGKLGVDILFSEEQLKIGQRLSTKLWNAFKFCHEHISSANIRKPKNHVPTDAVNKWLCHRMNQTYTEYLKAFDAYEYHHALEVVEKLFWNDFCDNYLELIKDRLFNPDKYDASVNADTIATLYEVGLAILKMFAPIMPHITETLFGYIYAQTENAPSLHATTFTPERYAHYHYADDAEIMDRIVEVVSAVRKLKSENQVSLKTPIEVLSLSASDTALLKKIQEHETLIKGVTLAVHIKTSHLITEENVMVEVDGVWHAAISMEKE